MPDDLKRAMLKYWRGCSSRPGSPSSHRDAKPKIGGTRTRHTANRTLFPIYAFVQPTITYLPLLPKKGQPPRVRSKVRRGLGRVLALMTHGVALGGRLVSTLLTFPFHAKGRSRRALGHK